MQLQNPNCNRFLFCILPKQTNTCSIGSKYICDKKSLGLTQQIKENPSFQSFLVWVVLFGSVVWVMNSSDKTLICFVLLDGNSLTMNDEKQNQRHV